MSDKQYVQKNITNLLLKTQPLISSKVLTGKNPQGFKEYGLEFNSFLDFNKHLWIYCGKKSCKHKKYDKSFQYSSNVSIREHIQEKATQMWRICLSFELSFTGDASQRIHVAETCCKYKEQAPYFMKYSAFTYTGDFIMEETLRK